MSTDVTTPSVDSAWETPQYLFNKLNEEFQFTTDICSSDEDLLVQDWTGSCWVNPPYGRQMGTWLQKAYEASLTGTKVVCLIPSRTETKYWHNYCMRASEIRFLTKRIKFGQTAAGSPIPSAIVIFDISKHLPVIVAYDI